jgi:4-amino-4-deoxy-L-arabinose transferase-like glycosyltransferase
MTSSDLAISRPAAPPVTRREVWTVAAITAAFTALVAFWTILTPLYDAPDEPLHFNSAVRLAEGGGWPAPGDAELQTMILAARGEGNLPASERSTFLELRESHPGYRGVDQMTQHPPLYYAYSAAVLSAVDFMNIRADLALLAVRLGGLLFVIPLPLLAWASVRRITRSSRAAIVASTAVFAVPQLAHIMGSVSNDGMAVLFSSVVVWLAIRIMTGDSRWITTVGIGVALALALFTKGTTLPLVPFVAIVMLIWPTGLRIGRRVLHAAVAMAIAFGGGWWWARNLLVYGSLQPDGLKYPTQPWPPGTGPRIFSFIDAAWGGLPTSFWGNFGWLSHPLPAVLSDVLTVLAAGVIAGFAFRKSRVRGMMIALASLPVIFLVALIATTWAGYVRTQLPAGMQGRYFFVVLIALVVLSAVGWLNFVVPAHRIRTGIVLLSVFAGVAAFAVVFEFRAVYKGVSDLFARAPVGAAGVILVAAVAAVLGGVALAAAITFIRTRPLPESAS